MNLKSYINLYIISTVWILFAFGDYFSLKTGYTFDQVSIIGIIYFCAFSLVSSVFVTIAAIYHIIFDKLLLYTYSGLTVSICLVIPLLHYFPITTFDLYELFMHLFIAFIFGLIPGNWRCCFRS